MARKKEEESFEISKDILYGVIEFFSNQQAHLLMEMHARQNDESVRRRILEKAKEEFRLRKITEQKQLDAYVETFARYIWGYYVLDPLLDDESISDIKCYSHNHIRIKRDGKRMDGDVAFLDEEDYRRFVQIVATKNEENLSAINKQITFADDTSHNAFKLRFNISEGRLQSDGMPFMHIRKTPKNKLFLSDLVKKKFLTEEQKRYFEQKVRYASGIYITGKGSVGKTTFLNALIEEIPEDCSGLAISESDDLFATRHPDILFQHEIMNKGEGKISYSLKDLATVGLMIDLDYFITSEIKGDEAGAFSLAFYTGHKGLATGHGASCEDGIEKLADYIQRATGDPIEKCYKVISKLEVVVFIDDYQIKEIKEIKGYKDGYLIFQDIFGGAA